MTTASALALVVVGLPFMVLLAFGARHGWRQWRQGADVLLSQRLIAAGLGLMCLGYLLVPLSLAVATPTLRWPLWSGYVVFLCGAVIALAGRLTRAWEEHVHKRSLRALGMPVEAWIAPWWVPLCVWPFVGIAVDFAFEWLLFDQARRFDVAHGTLAGQQLLDQVGPKLLIGSVLVGFGVAAVHGVVLYVRKQRETARTAALQQALSAAGVTLPVKARREPAGGPGRGDEQPGTESGPLPC